MKGLGERIRSLRKAKHLTIVEVAKGTGIDQATLSRIENDKMTGTLDSHRRIAEILGLRLPDLYDTVMRQIAESKDKKILQKFDTFSHAGGAVAELLTTGVLQKKMMPVLIKLKAKGRTETEELALFSERFIYVLKGAVDIGIAKAEKTLNAGESLYFNASQPHHFKNRLKSESWILSVVTPVSL